MSRLTTLILYATVFFTGAAVLIFEVAAVRLFAPYFGSSLYVLSSVLTVILAALSLGYFYGGRLADRLPYFLPLYSIIMGAGALMLILLYTALQILPYTTGIFSILSGPLVMAVAIFFVPAFMLGIDSPFVIKLISERTDQDHNGAVVGSTFFWSTVGSIVGSISAGFILIPTFGLTATIASISMFLIVWSAGAVITLHYTTPNVHTPVSIQHVLLLITTFVVIGGIGLYGTLTYTPHNERITTLYQTDGYYSNIHVYEQTAGTTTYRFLKRDTNHSSAILPGSDVVVFPYAQLANDYTNMVPDATSYLVLGGGAYTIPRHLHTFDPALTIDVVELEPSLAEVAYTYFELPKTPNINLIEGDARRFLQTSTSTYDVIFSDVMNSGHYIPPHLSTVEFFTAMKQRLNPDGVAFINFIGNLNTTDRTLSGSMIRTIASIFPNYELVALYGPTNPDIQNLVFVVRHDDQPISFTDETIVYPLIQIPSQLVTNLLVDTAQFNLTTQDIFTDNHSSIEPLIFKQFSTQ